MGTKDNERFEGTPHSRTSQEFSIWKKFLQWLKPFIHEKSSSPNQYGEDRIIPEDELTKAKANKQNAKAEKIRAKTSIMNRQAMEQLKATAVDADRIEKKKIETNPIENKSDEQKQVEFKQLLEQLRMLKIVYGVEVSISLEDIRQMASGNESLREVNVILRDTIIGSTFTGLPFPPNAIGIGTGVESWIPPIITGFRDTNELLVPPSDPED